MVAASTAPAAQGGYGASATSYVGVGAECEHDGPSGGASHSLVEGGRSSTRALRSAAGPSETRHALSAPSTDLGAYGLRVRRRVRADRGAARPWGSSLRPTRGIHWK